MKLIQLGPSATYYRAFTPKWAYAPESGEGSVLAGGRFNRKGLRARYLAQTINGALAEYQQSSPLLAPTTVASFLVTANPVVDFTAGYTEAEWSGIWQDAYCNWLQLAFRENVDPPSWIIGDLVVASGAAGILYRSALDPQAVCLVLYPDNSKTYTAPVHDPMAALPADQSSWPRSLS